MYFLSTETFVSTFLVNSLQHSSRLRVLDFLTMNKWIKYVVSEMENRGDSCTYTCCRNETIHFACEHRDMFYVSDPQRIDLLSRFETFPEVDAIDVAKKFAASIPACVINVCSSDQSMYLCYCLAFSSLVRLVKVATGLTTKSLANVIGSTPTQIRLAQVGNMPAKSTQDELYTLADVVWDVVDSTPERDLDTARAVLNPHDDSWNKSPLYVYYKERVETRVPKPINGPVLTAYEMLR